MNTAVGIIRVPSDRGEIELNTDRYQITYCRECPAATPRGHGYYCDEKKCIVGQHCWCLRKT